MSKKKFLKGKTNKFNKEERKMNIMEQHELFYNNLSKEEEEELKQLMIETVTKGTTQDIEKWVNKFMKETEKPSEIVQAINNALETDTTGKSRDEIISNVIKEKADKNYKEIKKIEKKNSSSRLDVIRTDIDECMIRENGMPIFEGDIATAIQELNTYITMGTKVTGLNSVFINMEDKISPEEQEKILKEIGAQLEHTSYGWIKIERISEINKWIVIDCMDNKIIFQAPPEKLNKVLRIILMNEEEQADKNWDKIQELNNKLDVPVDITRIDKYTCNFMEEENVADIWEIVEVMKVIYQKEVWRKEANQRDFEKIQKMLEENPEYPINMVKVDNEYCELREKETNREIMSAPVFMVRTELERMIKEKAETNITVEEQIERLVKITEKYSKTNEE